MSGNRQEGTPWIVRLEARLRVSVSQRAGVLNPKKVAPPVHFRGMCRTINWMCKGVATSVLVLLLVSIAAPATCFGWEPSAADRLACCKQAHHSDCSDQMSADACCAGQEQSKQPASQIAFTSAVLASPSVAVVVLFFNTPPPGSPCTRVHELHVASLHSPPSLLRPPLRI
jgi:hypothetical protein